MQYVKIDFLIVIISIVTSTLTILINVAIYMLTHFSIANITETTPARKRNFLYKKIVELNIFKIFLQYNIVLVIS